jgi:Tfp pilus assembly protein PilO
VIKIDKQEIAVRLGALKNNAKAVLGIAVFLLIIDGAVILRGQFLGVGRMFASAKKLNADIKDAQGAQKFSMTNKDRVPVLEKEFAEVNKKIIKDEELPKALEIISKLAERSSVRIQQLRPLVDPAIVKQQLQNSTATYLRQKISLTVVTSFHNLGTFVALLENSSIFFDIRQIDIRVDEKEVNKQSVTILLEVVVKKA